MHLDPDDSMGLAIVGVYEPLETRLVFDLVRPGFTVLDIGANIGYYTLLFARLVGPTGHVFAFEPDPISFSLLSKNVLSNGYENVSTFQMAVASQDGELQLYRDRFSNLEHRIVKPSSNASSLTVRAVKLDNFLPQISNRQIDFAKIDIEGSEGFALEGMVDTVSQSDTSSILTEYKPAALQMTGYGSDRYLRKLATLGYELIDIGDQGVERRPATVEQLIEKYPSDYPGHTNLLCRRNPQQAEEAR